MLKCCNLLSSDLYYDRLIDNLYFFLGNKISFRPRDKFNIPRKLFSSRREVFRE